MLTRFINTVINCMLAFLSSKAWLTDTSIAINLIHTSTTIITRINGTVINIDIAVRSSPAWLTRALITEKSIDADSPDTGFTGTQVHFLFTALASKPIGTITSKIMYQISAVSTKQTGLLCTIINVDLAESALPTVRALAGEATLWKSLATGSIGTGIALF